MNDIDLFAFHNKTGGIIKFKASKLMGVGFLHDKQTGEVVTNYGPGFDSPLHGQRFYDSEEALLATIIGCGI